MLELFIKLHDSLVMKLCLVYNTSFTVTMLYFSSPFFFFFFFCYMIFIACLLKWENFNPDLGLRISLYTNSLKRTEKAKGMGGRWATISKQSYSGALTWIKAVRMKRRGKKNRERSSRDSFCAKELTEICCNAELGSMFINVTDLH